MQFCLFGFLACLLHGADSTLKVASLVGPTGFSHAASCYLRGTSRGRNSGMSVRSNLRGGEASKYPHVDETGCRHHALFAPFNTRNTPADPSPDSPDCGLALIMVNYKLPRKLLELLWPQSSVRICADGAINRLYHTFDTDTDRSLFVPEYVRGDFDSVQSEIKDYYSSKGTQIVYDSNQDTTDLEKCIDLLLTLPLRITQVVVLGAFGGRIDHEFSHYHVLFKYADVNIVLLSTKRAAFLLGPGRHRIASLHLGPNCGIVPLGEAARSVTTSGLKWDLHDQTMSIMGLVSTSNKMEGDAVDVTTSHPLLWVSDVQPPVPDDAS